MYTRTNKIYDSDLKFLLNSIIQYEPNIPIYILCDTYVYNKVNYDYPTLNIKTKLCLDKYSNLSRAEMDAQNLFCDLCFEKVNTVDFALEECNNSLYLDADIILLDKLDIKIPIEYELGLSRYKYKETADKFC